MEWNFGAFLAVIQLFDSSTVYLGGYDKEEKAARAYDLATLMYWGPTATTNFPVSNYSKELEEMKHVTKHHQQSRWQARIGRVAGNKDLYLGTFATEEKATEAYDIAAIKFRGANAVMNRYDVEVIMKSSLPVGGIAVSTELSLMLMQLSLMQLNLL
ncbi:hypothetical protein ACSQ67_003835 [Phaseolus vulgaris]|uniref:AP2-like ethylene-responsive transcription factor AIL7 n=1 Tax=Phaseolus vulgaris TaxID=3885 RepID=UPI0035C944FA